MILHHIAQCSNIVVEAGPADRAIVARFGQRLVDKMFHHLVSRIRALAEYDEVPPDVTMQVLARLFADPDSEEADTPTTHTGQ